MTDPQPKAWIRFFVSGIDFSSGNILRKGTLYNGLLTINKTSRKETIEVIELGALDELRRERDNAEKKQWAAEKLNLDARSSWLKERDQLTSELTLLKLDKEHLTWDVEHWKKKCAKRDKQLALAKDYVMGGIKAMYFQMRKEYLAQADIDKFLAEIEKLETDHDQTK